MKSFLAVDQIQNALAILANYLGFNQKPHSKGWSIGVIPSHNPGESLIYEEHSGSFLIACLHNGTTAIHTLVEIIVLSWLTHVNRHVSFFICWYVFCVCLPFSRCLQIYHTKNKPSKYYLQNCKASNRTLACLTQIRFT